MLRNEFRLKPSRIFSILLVTLFLIVLSAIFVSELKFWLKGILFLITIFYSFYIFYRHVLLLHPKSIIKIIALSDNQILAVTKDQSEFVEELQGESVVTHFVSILLLKNKIFKNLKCIIWRDSLETYRELILALRLNR